MICPNCKAEIPDGIKFCSNCGNPIETVPVVAITAVNKWEQYLALIGAGLGIGTGLISLIGWFSPWTSLNFGNGPQLIVLPFGMGLSTSVLNEYPALGSILQSVNQITGWVLLLSILLAIISIALGVMCIFNIWMGIKCLEYRSDPKLLPAVKTQISKIRNYSLAGIILVVIVMVMLSIFQIGRSVIGGGIVAMAFGFVAAFVMVIYLQPHLR